MDYIDNSNKSIEMMMHLLSSTQIANALISAHRRGVEVKVIGDVGKCTAMGSQFQKLSENGISIRIPMPNRHMHSKLVILDGRLIMVGSLNLTLQGFNGNWDNLIITSQEDIVQDAIEAFNAVWTMKTGVSHQCIHAKLLTKDC